MALVVVGGQSRNVGKTSVVAGLIAALPQFNWSAMKISQHGHGIYSHGADQDHGWAISEEHDRSESTDTSRFLQAGAHRVWWVRSQPGRLAEAVPTVRNLLADCQHAILESNSILKFLRPDLYLTVLDPDTADFKPSAREFLDRADAVLLNNGKGKAKWDGISLEHLSGRPVFPIQPPEYVTPEIVGFVRERLKL